jgi:hypothetical protein
MIVMNQIYGSKCDSFGMNFVLFENIKSSPPRELRKYVFFVRVCYYREKKKKEKKALDTSRSAMAV